MYIIRTSKARDSNVNSKMIDSDTSVKPMVELTGGVILILVRAQREVFIESISIKILV